ncbi:MAG: hypothetical protein FWE62_06890 [Firmicutes bacterium]|nr:hypothetical protein [Bacillota bacterium]
MMNEEMTAYGKFKNADELYKAYCNLEREFTRKSQKLKELETMTAAESPDKPDADAFGIPTPVCCPSAEEHTVQAETAAAGTINGHGDGPAGAATAETFEAEVAECFAQAEALEAAESGAPETARPTADAAADTAKSTAENTAEAAIPAAGAPPSDVSYGNQDEKSMDQPRETVTFPAASESPNSGPEAPLALYQNITKLFSAFPDAKTIAEDVVARAAAAGDISYEGLINAYVAASLKTGLRLDDDFIGEMLKNPDSRHKIFTAMKSAASRTPPLMSNAGRTPPSPVYAPKTLSEAGEMLTRMFNM